MGGDVRVPRLQGGRRRLVCLDDMFQHCLCSPDGAWRPKEANFVHSGIHRSQLGRVMRAFLDHAVSIGFRCLVDELAEQPLAARALLFEPLRIVLMMLGRPGRGDG